MKIIKFYIRVIGIVFLVGNAALLNAAPTAYTGVNLAGAEFGEGNLPGTYGTHYIYPTRGEVDYFRSKGMNTFRLPFRWERLQQSQFAAFNTAEQARLDDFVNYATGAGAFVILDPHNYARYYGTVIGQGVPASAFADFWSRLANHYKTNPRVIFGLMNEPNTMPTELWRDDANAAIAAIRATGAANLILVPGNAWTGAHSWLQNWYGTPNGTVMLTINDPGNNYAFDAHQYLDGDSSGTSDQCVSQTVGSQRLVDFTNWLRTNNRRGFLGEFGGGRNATCYAAMDNMLDYVEANNDVWLGWTYWAAGPWWGDYIFTIEPTGCPTNCADRPQMAVLAEHLIQPSFAPPRRAFDFDGDGRADIAVFRPADGVWYLDQSFYGPAARRFGAGADKIVPADYDGDGKTDVAVYRAGIWYLQRSRAGFTGIAFGAADDVPVPADYDGDDKSDVAVFRPSSGVWYLLQSTAGFTGISFGQTGDKPAAADYDGDGRADIAVFRGGAWYIQKSTLGFTGIQFGDGADKTVPADYDGDGKTDVAVFRPSTGVWYLLQSQTGFTGIRFGAGTDLPAPADYDGDGRTDVAVFRGGTWYLNRSAQGFTGVAFGAATDSPVPNAFVR